MLEPRQTTDSPPDATRRGGSAPAQTSARGAPNQTPSRELDDLLGMDDLSEEPLESPARPRRWWLVATGAALVVTLIAGALVVRAQGAKAPISYQTATISQGNLALTVSGTGPVQAALYNLNFSASGRITEIDVQVGQMVKAGQTLAKLDTTALRDALNQAQLQANSAYFQEQQAINNCNTEPNPPPDCVALAENQYAAALQQLQTAKDNLSGATLKTTHAGVVTAINGSVGGSPSSGSGSGSSSSSGGFIQIADPSSLQLLASVNETDIGGVASGQQATFTVTAYPGKVFRATVASISQVGTTSSNVVTFPVTLNVDMTRLQGVSLYTNMTASVTIVTARRVNVTLIPTSAVTFARAAANTSAGGFLTRAQVTDALTQARQMIATLEQQNPQISQDSPTAAWALERAGGKWIVKPIVIGLSSGSVDEVLAGLNPGEVIITGETNGTITTTSSGASSTTGGGRFGGGGGFGGGGFGGGAGGNGR
ncbi:MAG TPA: efflux RND transporter periplasmic adaptor subunit [Ktedonobacterales bacterium]|nr:efflux RND transporter periplasmic adaptor subunit [Ktedonobacterales bacterium]